MKLVIVESPAKAKTIAKYLGKDFMIESSIGHIRDLPRNAADVPTAFKKESWARLGIDVDNNFKPLYVVAPEKKKHVEHLKKCASKASEIILATDDDREGESIAWHLYKELNPKVPVKRMVFHEITKDAIQKAINNPRQINTDLVEAQETRRALDRLYGYVVSPVLWRKIAPKLSAGRVQSVATRMLVERERQRMAFVSASWWDIKGKSRKNDEIFDIYLHRVGKKIATGKDFDSLGNLKNPEVLLLDQAQIQKLIENINSDLEVIKVEERPFIQKPPSPFITSTLQQEGGRKLKLSARDTMQTAQRLYEAGYITYMRTDSTNLSQEAIKAAMEQVKQMYGEEYVSPKPRIYSTKSKNAQEAHEAIRPTGTFFRTPMSLKNELSDIEWELYDLIWKRTISSQMQDAKGISLRVRLKTNSAEQELIFAANGRSITFFGFLRAYVEGSDDPFEALSDKEHYLPNLQLGEKVKIESLTPESHQTQPPARFTEASLVQALESAGIGRPSTYASIIQTIQDRGYAYKKSQVLIPNWIAFSTLNLLESHFTKFVDYDFTAKMEEDLDLIAEGKEKKVPYLQKFYFGQPQELGLKPLVDQKLDEIDAKEVSTIRLPKWHNTDIELRTGRYGAYIQQGERKANLPDITPDELTLQEAQKLLEKASKSGEIGINPESNEMIFLRVGRYGYYLVEGDKMASLFPLDNPDTLTLNRAIELLSLPRLVGHLENEEIWAHNGPYGPYLKKGRDSRRLENHEQLLTITEEEAKVIYLQPKTHSSNKVLKIYKKEGEPDIKLRLGRFGNYLTDGEKNATLKANEINLSDEEIFSIFIERAKEPKNRKSTKKSTKKLAKKSTKKTSDKIPWEVLKNYLDVLNEEEREFITLYREQKLSIQQISEKMNLPENKIKGLNLLSAKKLNKAARDQLNNN